MMRQGPAPAARAASITPGLIVTRFCSTIRENPNVTAIERGTTAAVVPIAVPTTAAVTGDSARISTMNGIGRNTFTRRFSTTLTARFGSTPPVRVT